MTTDIAAHIAEVRGLLYGSAPGCGNEACTHPGCRIFEMLPQTIDLLEAEHARAERLAALVREAMDFFGDDYEVRLASLRAALEVPRSTGAAQ